MGGWLSSPAPNQGGGLTGDQANRGEVLRVISRPAPPLIGVRGAGQGWGLPGGGPLGIGQAVVPPIGVGGADRGRGWLGEGL